MRNHHFTRALSIGFALLLTTAAVLNAQSVEDELRGMEEQWGQAIVKKDLAAVDRLLAPKVIYAHASGAVETKQLYMERLKGGKQRYDTFTREKCIFVPYHRSGAVHCTVRVTGKNDSGDFNDHVLMTHMWVKDGRNWRIAAHHTTRIP